MSSSVSGVTLRSTWEHRSAVIATSDQLRPPPLPAVVWVPPALEGRRELLTGRALVTVTAGPGWGKSTLLAHLLPAEDTRWYRIEEADRDLAAFTTGLLTALGAPPSGPPAGPQTGPPTDLTVDAAAELLTATLAGRPPVRLVLDDAQSLRGSAALELLRRIATHLPDELRLVVCSRRDLGLVDDRTRGFGRTLEVDARDLTLDLPAVEAVVTGELTRDRPLAARITDATGGWPVGVRLAIDALSELHADDRSAAVERLTGPRGPIGRYLRRIVAAGEDTEVHLRLAYLHLLDGATTEHLAALEGRPVSALDEAVEALLRRGLARPRGDDPEVVELSPAIDRLVGDHLLPGLDQDGEVVDTVVAHLCATGEHVDALRLLDGSGRSEASAALLTRQGRRLIHAGHLTAVARSTAALPDHLRTPAIESLRAEALAFLGEWAQALRCLDAAAIGDDGPLSVEVATQLGLIHHTRGDLAAAVTAYLRVTRDGTDPQEAALLGWQATAHWLRGELDQARACATEAMEIALRFQDDRGLAYAHTALALMAASDGDRRANLDHYHQALAAATAAGDRLQQARILTNLGSHHLEEGRYPEALEVTGQAIDLAEPQGFATLIGIARCNRSEALLRTGAVDEAIADAERAREVFARIGARTEAYAHHMLAGARADRGELALARQAYERALELGSPSGDRQALVPALLGLAWVLTGTDPEAAADAVARAREMDNGINAAEVAVIEAWVTLSRGDAEGAAELACTARELAVARGSQAEAALASTCLAVTMTDPESALEDALARWRELGSPLWVARTELALARRSGASAARARVTELEREVARLGCPLERSVWAAQAVTGSAAGGRTVLRALGSFSVSRDAQPVPTSAWGSRKARELVKALITRAPRGITREELGHLLWPDEPYERVSGRLSTALSLARSALAGEDPGRDDAPIETEGTTVRLSRDRVEVDVVAFRRLADSGLNAVRDGDDATAMTLLLEAEELYGGDLFEDDPDLPWAEDRRAELRSLYLSVARILAKLVSVEDPELTIRLLLRVLDRDGYDEPAHLNLAVALLRTGRHGEARRRYHLYLDRMAELDLPAVPFHELTRDLQRTAPRLVS